MKTYAPAAKPASVVMPSDGGVAAIVRTASVLIILLAITGCESTNGSKEPLPVSVSAANYSQLSGKELYARINAPDDIAPEPPAVKYIPPM